MNARERFLAVMGFEPVDRTLLWEFGYWSGAVRRWYREGLPKQQGIPDWLPDGKGILGEGIYWDPTDPTRIFGADLHECFGLDEGLRQVPLNIYFNPPFEEVVLEDHGDWVVSMEKTGIIKRDRKDRASLPDYVGWPVKTREDWERLKAERLQPTLEGRLPANWSDFLKEYPNRTYPLAIGGQQGFFGTPRYLLGPENLLVSYYDDPDLIHDTVSYLASFWASIYDQVLSQVKPDIALIWEDMCYKAGPLVSPATFREFILPGYRKLTGVFRDHGVNCIAVDTDGDCWKLIPLFVEGGVTCLYPFEVNANMDVSKVREAYPKLQMFGGVDKVAMAVGKEQIDGELKSKVAPVLKTGGYIPYCDHLVPPDVSWQNFVYYRRRLAEVICGK